MKFNRLKTVVLVTTAAAFLTVPAAWWHPESWMCAWMSSC